MDIKKKIATTLLIAVTAINVNATIRLPVIFQNNMVLQRDKKVAIWGFGKAGEKVVISFKDRKSV